MVMIILTVAISVMQLADRTVRMTKQREMNDVVAAFNDLVGTLDDEDPVRILFFLSFFPPPPPFTLCWGGWGAVGYNN